MIWSGLIEVVRALVFAASHVCGCGFGGGILVISFLDRIALLPMTLRVAVRMRDHQARLAGVAIGVAPSTNKMTLAMSMALTGFFAWRLSASVGLCWVASNSVGAAQPLILRRSAPAAPKEFC
jgi:membrane protein insertase Oxa1/YidC/SpoIIIJ